jgi:hypothetical protein
MAELMRRYVVMAMVSEAPFDPSDPEGVFVLKPWKDPAALRALEAYRDNCYPELARDLDAWIMAIATGPSVRGDVGRRNEPHVKSRPVSSNGAPATGARGRGARRGTSAARRAGPKRRGRSPAGKRKKRSR